jgi:hypothetical protein
MTRQLLINVKTTIESQCPVEEKKEGEGQELLQFNLTNRSNASGLHVKMQVMEELGSLRLVDLLACSYAHGVHNLGLQFATLQLVNQICDETPMNYK